MANKSAWNYVIAEKLLKQFKNRDEIVIESGFGPSGYPHIGTYGEISRPKHVIKALNDLSDKKTKYIVFTDDMDGLRKVPLGMPDELKEHLGKPVSRIPDPWGCCKSFSDHIINHIKGWLEKQGLTYDQFIYSHESYESGAFNDGLIKLLKNHEKVLSIILPTMREESRKGWSHFMPICEKCGRNLSTRVTKYMPETNSLAYICDKDSENFKSCGHEAETTVLDGNVKVGWKIDWALRWYTYGVNFEMYGKDLMEAATLSGKIVKTALGGRSPMGYFYEMFLDDNGQKISKSVGKGLGVDEWFAMAPKESLDLLLFKAPQKAKKMSYNIIPRYVDEYLDLMKRHYVKPENERIEDGKYRDAYEFIASEMPQNSPYEYKVNFNLLTNLIAAVGKADLDIIKAYVHKYEDEKPASLPYLERLIEKAGVFVKEVMLANLEPFQPSDVEKTCLTTITSFLEEGGHSEEEIQTKIFDTAKANELNPKQLFTAIYRLLSGQVSGPRLGSFISIMGEDEVAKRIKDKI
jgi:lysyl-tRNA synthetase class 1